MLAAPLKHIQVCCRIRGVENQEHPTISSYLNDDGTDSKSGTGRSYEVVTPNGNFQMDYAFDSGDSQECIYERIVQPLLLDAFAGFNCSLFSYGQTGSGKTYTLVGDAGSCSLQLDNKNRGIIPRAAEQIFAKQASFDPQKTTCQVKLSILEVYQEQLKDLLGTQVSSLFNSSNNTKENGAANSINTASHSGLRIREQIDGTVWVEGLTEQVVNSAPDFNRLLNSALKRRVVGSHAMNDVSSRSHFCCIVNIHQVFHTTGVKINSKVHFIDLAGSEMVRKTDATGVRFSEAKHINKSLSALGNVIYALSGGTSKATDALNATLTAAVTAAAAASATGGGVLGSTTLTSSNLASSQVLKHGISGSNNSLTSLVTSGSNGNNNSNNNINGNAIATAAGANKAHIPYRDSKLTRLLQNSLGGNAKTVIILTISDAKKHLAETVSTLRFGARARQIVIKPILNKSVVEDQALLKKQYSKAVQENRDLQELVAQLQGEIFTLRQQNAHRSPDAKKQQQSNNKENPGPLENEELVCEICRDFLNSKLRSSGLPQQSGDFNIKTKESKQKPKEAAHPVLRQYSTEQAQRSVLSPPPVSSVAAINDDFFYETAPVEPLERCAICGLSGDEADKLQMYTGEMLGEMFSCDGNCGHQFHVRCVGLLGEGGQYTLPEGEWFCTECYSSDNTSPDQNITSLSEKDIDGAEDSTATSADALYSRLSHQDLELAAAESLHIAPNRNPSSVLATIKSEYHTMRKERNRILAQWQQEKRIIEKYEISRRIEQQKRDQELVRAKETITQLESLVTQGEAQSTRMQKLFDIMLKELQQQNATFSATTNSSSSAASANTTAIRNSVDRLKWASLTVETLLDTPIERLADDDDSESASPSPHGKTSGGRSSIDGAGVPAGEGRPPVKKLQQSASSPSQLTIAHLYGNTGLSAATAQQESSSSGIPKPWKGGNKVRTGAPGQGDPAPSPAITAVTAAGAPDSSSSNRLKIENSPKERRQGPTLNTQANRHSDRGRILSGSPSSDFSKTQPAVVITPNSSSAGVNGGGNKEEQSAASSSSQLLRRHSSVTAETNSRSPTKEIHATHKAAGGAGAEVESGVGKSKFINPLKNRLRDLLLSVEAETDAFAEIRQKFKSRGDERNQLRNSHNAEN